MEGTRGTMDTLKLIMAWLGVVRHGGTRPRKWDLSGCMVKLLHRYTVTAPGLDQPRVNRMGGLACRAGSAAPCRLRQQGGIRCLSASWPICLGFRAYSILFEAGRSNQPDCP